MKLPYRWASLRSAPTYATRHDKIERAFFFIHMVNPVFQNSIFKFLCIIGCLLLALPSMANTEDYSYPFADPYVATVVGTPQALRAPLPERIPIRDLELTVFEDRTLPEVLWYGKKMRYSLAAQSQKAPLIFIIAGTGASYHSSKMQSLQKAFFQAGFHVLSLSSPTHPNFITSASQTGVPGSLEQDAEDLYRVMQLAWQRAQDRLEVTEFYLTGYSLGAAQAAFVSRLDEKQPVFNFRKVLLINPPVSLYNSVSILDDMLDDNLSEDKYSAFLDRLFSNFAELYKREDFVDFSGDFLYQAYQQLNPPQEGLAALIGLSFRLSSANMVFTSDVFTNAGYIKPKNLRLSTTDSTADYLKVATRLTFLNYFHELYLPYYQSRQPQLSEEEAIYAESLQSIEDYLRRTSKIGLITNADDLILAPGDINYLRQVFGPRAKIYPHGGHCGNMEHRDNVAYMVQFFTQRNDS